MAIKRRGLGLGLDALLGPAASPEKENSRAEGEFKMLPVDLLQRGKYQPRSDMRSESLQELADSIRVQGVVQPIIVRPLEHNDLDKTLRYEIIAGERRWRAAQLAGLKEVPTIVRDVEDRAAVAMTLIENIQREDLNPLEEAGALKRLIDEFKMTHQEAAEAVGRSRAAVSNLLRLLDLEQGVKSLIEHRELEMGHARAILGLDIDRQVQVAKQVAESGLSVRDTERLVKRLQAPDSDSGKPEPRTDPDVKRLETDLAERLGARVRVQQASSGNGKLVIHYHSLDELDGILAHIK